MKMNKILAAGIAATLAVTSLSAVVSAETQERSFDMEYSVGILTWAPSTQNIDGVDLGDAYTAAKLAASNTPHATAIPEFGGEAAYDKYDAYIPLEVKENGTVVTDAAKLKGYAGKIVVEITGQQLLAGGTAQTITAKMTSIYDATDGLILPVYVTNGPAGAFVWDKFGGFNSLKATNAQGYDNKTKAVYTEAEYNAFKIDGSNVLADTVEVNIPTGKGLTAKQTGALVASDVATLLNSYIGKGFKTTWKSSAKEIKNYAAWLPMTTENLVMTRFDIDKLSKTDDYNSEGVAGENDADQSYKELEYNKGDAPVGFSGLAGQVADFFNKQTNGKITFTFTAAAGGSQSSWLNGGIPSTEVGIKNVMAQSTSNDFALFINYGSTTGSLQAVTELDPQSGSVSFDITEILEDLGGYTKGTVQDIYYGMNKYASVLDSGAKGMWVSNVTLSYEEDSDVDADIEDDTAADDDDDTAADDDDDAVIADDDDDVVADDDDDVVADDDDDADDDIGGDIDPVTPADDDDDANPGTGVALAVVPAIVAAAAVVVSKKRK